MMSKQTGSSKAGMMICDADWDFLNSILPVSRETQLALSGFVDLLCKWQNKTNLVAQNTLTDVWNRHVADSLQVLSLIMDGNKGGFDQGQNWLDLGSGGGFPGLVMALILGNEARWQGIAKVHLIESNGKKCAFLRQANRTFGGCAVIHNQRIEDSINMTSPPQIVTARALASLRQLLQWIVTLSRPSARIVLHKGREYRRELEECRGLWTFDLVEHQSRLEADSVILEITNLKPV